MALLLWSGGCDSTLLLYKMLRAYKNGTEGDTPYFDGIDLKDGEYVRTVAINHPQVSNNHVSALARIHIADLLRKRLKIDFEHSETTITQGSISGIVPNGGLTQPIVWLANASLYLNGSEDLYAGYVQHDDIWHYKEQLYSVFKVLQGFTHKTGSLRCPFEWKEKPFVIKELRKAKLLKYAWFCEDPKKMKPCKKCPSCFMHKTAVWQINELEKMGAWNETPLKPAKLIGRDNETEMCHYDRPKRSCRSKQLDSHI